MTETHSDPFTSLATLHPAVQVAVVIVAGLCLLVLICRM